MSETVTVKGRTVEHNTRPWSTRTNRHTTTSGYDWGWIEGAPGNECWSDDKAFNYSAASEMCRLHNQWLEEQKPVDIRIKEQSARVRSAQAEHVKHVDAAANAKKVLDEETRKLIQLYTEDYECRLTTVCPASPSPA